MYLNCHTYYSLRYGTLTPEELVSLAAKNNIKTLVLTDINNSAGLFDFIKACLSHNIKPVAGMEFRQGNKLLYLGIAINNKGFNELNQFITHHNLSQTPLPSKAPHFEHCYLIYPWQQGKTYELKSNEYIGIRAQELNQLVTSPYLHQQHKLVVWQAVTFKNKAGYELHKHLRAIDTNCLLSKVDINKLAKETEWMVPPCKLINAYAQYPTIINTTEELLDTCRFDFDFKSIKNKQIFTSSKDEDKQLLHQLAIEGMDYRYGKDNTEALARIHKELAIIDQLGFCAYFLITWDIIRYSLSREYYHVGRGSGANSVVAYCLRITDVDPIELNLYFERFLNPKRSSPPDFDIDYSWKERDNIQQYIFNRYGKEHVALLGAMSTFQGKSILRELGKVYGLPKEEIDRLVESPEESQTDTISQKIFKIGAMMNDFPNQRTIHAGGILISEEPLTHYTALDLPPKGFPTTQWDMYVAEDIGFEKLDILSQRGIGHIKDCVSLVFKNKGIRVDAHQVASFKTDEAVKELLRSGETNGCFYVESPAMRGLLKKLKCDNYTTLVAASSIIRPGVAKSGMMRQYIQRFHAPTSYKHLHPVMQEQLEETYGVMVYQEDVLKVCHHFAGLDLADADVLRRAMSGKHRSKTEFQRIVDKFFSNCHAKGYSLQLTQEVWRQIESFAGYSFSKAHSASYAVESFQSLYLKAHYPMEFMVAVINNFGGFYQTEIYVNEARRWGAQIHPPCINNSTYLTSIQTNDIYLGFIHIQNLDQYIGQQIEKERAFRGVFIDLHDFIVRTGAGREQMILLIRIGAFRFLKKNKPQLLWEVHLLLGKKEEKHLPQPLFTSHTKQYALPPLTQTRIEDAYDEIELLGFPVSCTSFDLLQTSFKSPLSAQQFPLHIGKKVRIIGQLVCIKYVRTARQQTMNFGTFIDEYGEFFDTVHFPQALKAYPFKGLGTYLILGKIIEEFGYASLEVEKMAKLPIVSDPRNT